MRKLLKNWLPDHQTLQQNRWLARLAPRLTHPRLWHLNRHSAAGGVAAGLFCGLIPGPFQMPAAALCALVFRVNLPLAMVTTLYTNPFTLVPLYLLAYEIGSLFIPPEGQALTPPDFNPMAWGQWMEAMGLWILSLGKPLGLGLILLASLLAPIGYGVVRLLWRLYLVRAWQRRKTRRLQQK